MGVFFLTLSLAHSLTGPAEAALTKGRDKQFASGSANSGAEEGRASRFRATATIGETTANVKMTGAKFSIVPGFLSTTLSSGSGSVPVSDLDVAVVYAMTDSLGERISPQTWQRDNDPLFVWEPPPTGPDVAGYSYALDETPDDVIDTLGTSFDVATRQEGPLPDGLHTFRVKAINSAGHGGNAASVEIWVDTTPPQVASYWPQPGTVLSSRTPQPVTVTLTDAGSGVSASSLTLLINDSSVELAPQPSTPDLWKASSGAWAEGLNRLELRVADVVGNAQPPLVWSVTVDTQPPTGTLTINDGATVTSSVYVTLKLEASDASSNVSRILISNEEAVGYVEEPFAAVRPLWRLSTVRGSRTVYVKFMDEAGNISAPVSDTIDLTLLSPETVITSGPAGMHADRSATFAFLCPEGDCVFSYAFDHDDWSPWASTTTAQAVGLPFGNHYFRVKAAKDVNNLEGIQADEEDPSPSERTWIIGVESPLSPIPTGPPVKLWRLE